MDRKALAKDGWWRIRRYYKLRPYGSARLDLFEKGVNRVLSSGRYNPNRLVEDLYNLSDDLKSADDFFGHLLYLTKAYNLRGLSPKNKALITEHLAQVYIDTGKTSEARRIVRQTLSRFGKKHQDLRAPLEELLASKCQ